MYKKIYLTLICILFIHQLFGQVSGNILYNEESRWKFQNEVLQNKPRIQNMNELTLEVSALHNATAVSYLAIFHITQTASSARECDSLMNRRVFALRDALIDLGVPKEDFMTDMLSMVPLYEVEVTKKLFSKTYNEVPAGFEIQKNIHIAYKDPQLLDYIITEAAFQEIYDLVKVEYFIENEEAIYQQLREKSTELIKERVKQYEELGIKLEGQWRMAMDNQSVYYPIERYTTYQAKSKPSLAGIKKGATVNQSPVIQTIFYNKVPYKGYDIVVNPEFKEPQVQFTYNLTVKFIVQPKKEEKAPEPKTEIVKEYHLVSPDGKVTKLFP